MKRPAPRGWALSIRSQGHSRNSFLRISSSALLTSARSPRTTGPKDAIFSPMGIPSRSHMTDSAGPLSIRNPPVSENLSLVYDPTSSPQTAAPSPVT